MTEEEIVRFNAAVQAQIHEDIKVRDLRAEVERLRLFFEGIAEDIAEVLEGQTPLGGPAEDCNCDGAPDGRGLCRPCAALNAAREALAPRGKP